MNKSKITNLLNNPKAFYKVAKGILLIALISSIIVLTSPLYVSLIFIFLLFILLGFLLSSGSKKNPGIDIFSPAVLFPSLWIGCVAVGSRIISIQQSEWNTTMWLAVTFALTGWIIGYFLSNLIFSAPLNSSDIFIPPFKKKLSHIWGRKNFDVLILFWFTFALICTAYEFKYVLGGIPIFGMNWEEDRFISLSGYAGRLIHIISYSMITLAMVIQAQLFSQKKIFSVNNLYYMIMLFLSLCICAMWGSRHTLFIPITVGVVLFHYLHYTMRIRHFIILGLAGLIFVGGIGYLRTSTVWQDVDIDYTEVLQELGYEGQYPIFDQAHNTIAINFETFHWLTDTVPQSREYQLGKFTFFPLYSMLPGKQDTLGEWQNKAWNTGFYANLTSTFMGPLYVDFGLPGIFIFTLLFAFFITILYKNMFKKPSIFNILFFAFFVNHIVMMPYDNTLTKLHFFFNILFLWFTDIFCKDNPEIKDNITYKNQEKSI